MLHRSRLLLLLVLLAACAHGGWISDRLYLGRAMPNGAMVSDEEWTRFVEEVVTPRFPDGLTVWRADGQWRDGNTTVREPVIILEVLHRGDAQSHASMLAIAEAYRTRFGQNVVLRVTTPARATFLSAPR